MTAPMIPPEQQQAQPPQPPVLPPLPNPFPVRPNDTEPAVALVYMKRLSKLFVDPKFESFPPEWQQLPIDLYTRVTQALQPPPQLPKGVSISDKVSGGGIAQEEQAAFQVGQPQPARPVVPPRPQAAKVQQMPTAPPGQAAL